MPDDQHVFRCVRKAPDELQQLLFACQIELLLELNWRRERERLSKTVDRIADGPRGTGADEIKLHSPLSKFGPHPPSGRSAAIVQRAVEIVERWIPPTRLCVA